VGTVNASGFNVQVSKICCVVRRNSSLVIVTATG
jgi:hypothetical protein